MSTHVLLARMDNVGDVLLAGPAVRAVAARAARVTFLASPRGAAAAELLPGVDEVLVHDCPWIEAPAPRVTRDAVDALVADVAARGISEAIVFTSFHQSPLPLALLLRLAGVETIAAISIDYPGSLLDVRHHVSDDVHEAQRALSLAAALGYAAAPDDSPRLAVRRPAARRAGLPGGPYVVVHPGASVPARAWPADSHAALVLALAERGRRVVVTGTAAEAPLTGRVVAGAPDAALDLGGRTDLAELAEILAGAAAVVVGNTGPAHLAAAVGTPVVSLFAPTVPAVRWRPWGVPHELLYVDVPCAGCRARDCPVPGHPCLAGVTVPAVVEAVERLAPAREAVPA
ncbi:MAG TPA: glycosyltransferase family 9 protein [Solirubrobacteraceae bacterium]|jgi:ADP-heptose:LPS heptosyltransferase